MKTIFRTPIALALVALATLILAAGCRDDGARPVPREAGRAYGLVILHTNDHHGAVLPVDGRGGLAERAAFVRSVRETNAGVLLLDAGDLNTGGALSNMFAAEPDILAYNAMGYDAAQRVRATEFPCGLRYIALGQQYPDAGR